MITRQYFANKTSIVFNLFWDNSITHVREIFITFFWGGEGRGQKRCIVEDVKMENVLIYAK